MMYLQNGDPFDSEATNMTTKRVYSCDICREVKEAKELIGIRFRYSNIFEIDFAQKTDGSHICSSCALQLKRQLNLNDQVKNILGGLELEK